jgi:hypothetical protein
MKLRLFCLLLVLTSCEGYTDGEGYVFDVKTNKPLEGVLVRSYARRGGKSKYQTVEMTTDSTGYFYGTTQLSKCIPDCPDLVVELIKDGYKTIEYTNPRKDTVYLEK